MPPLHQIRHEIENKRSEAATAQDTIRRQYLQKLANHTGRDTILYASAYASHALDPRTRPALVQITTEDIQGFMASLHGLRGGKLDLVLHSPGGSMEGAEQIVHYLREKYTDIRTIVPHNAMSAATMIACASNRIVMGKHSALGPIDPQISFNNFSAPAQAILDEFDRAKTEVMGDRSLAALWAPKIANYPIGLLATCERTLELAEMRVADWLNKYMFSSSRPLGADIAAWLSNAKEHRSHARPITAQQARDRGLVVDQLEDDQPLQELILSVFHAAMYTFQSTSCCKIIENHEGRGLYVVAKQK